MIQTQYKLYNIKFALNGHSILVVADTDSMTGTTASSVVAGRD